MTLSFTHDTLGQRVVLEAGKVAENVVADVRERQCSKVFLIADGSALAVGDLLQAEGLPVARRWDEVIQHVPTELAERARKAASEAGADCVVSVGGGSATGLAKAIALTSGVPIVAVPTTYAGSEATAMWGLTDDATKRTGTDPVVLPATVVYDPELLVSLPGDLAVASGLNALAHAVDALWAPKADPIATALALEGSRGLALGLPKVAADGRDVDGVAQTLYGAYLAAVSFATTGSGLHHKICHVLGGTFNLPHAPTHAVVLPYVLAFNESSVPELADRLAAVLVEGGSASGVSATEALERLRERTDAPRDLAAVGFTRDGIPDAVRRIVDAAPSSNPRPATPENMTQLLEAALTGADPRSIA